MRLELISGTRVNDCAAFQFHKGAIRTFDELLEEDEETYFNSIKVRLEQKYVFGVNNHLQDFNSIKVRLEQPSPTPSGRPAKRFQFHKGAIRTLLIEQSLATVLHFNSIKVRLEL